MAANLSISTGDKVWMFNPELSTLNLHSVIAEICQSSSSIYAGLDQDFVTG